MRTARPASKRVRSRSARSAASCGCASASSSVPIIDCSGLLISSATPDTKPPIADSRSLRTSCSRRRSSSVTSRITDTKCVTRPPSSTIGAAAQAAWNVEPSLRAIASVMRTIFRARMLSLKAATDPDDSSATSDVGGSARSSSGA